MSTSEIKILTFIAQFSAGGKGCSFFSKSTAQYLVLLSKFSNNYYGRKQHKAK